MDKSQRHDRLVHCNLHAATWAIIVMWTLTQVAFLLAPLAGRLLRGPAVVGARPLGGGQTHRVRSDGATEVTTENAEHIRKPFQAGAGY